MSLGSKRGATAVEVIDDTNDTTADAATAVRVSARAHRLTEKAAAMPPAPKRQRKATPAPAAAAASTSVSTDVETTPPAIGVLPASEPIAAQAFGFFPAPTDAAGATAAVTVTLASPESTKLKTKGRAPGASTYKHKHLDGKHIVHSMRDQWHGTNR